MRSEEILDLLASSEWYTIVILTRRKQESGRKTKIASQILRQVSAIVAYIRPEDCPEVPLLDSHIPKSKIQLQRILESHDSWPENVSEVFLVLQPHLNPSPFSG